MCNKRGKYAVGVDVGGSHVCSALVSLDSREIVSASVREMAIDSRASAETIIEGWSETIRATLSLSDADVAGIGWAFPGPFDYERGISLIRGVNKFDSIFGLDVAVTLPTRIGISSCRCRFVNDAGAFALGEAYGGAARSYNRVLVLTLGTGLGSGFIVDGRLVTSGEEVPANGWVYNLPFDGGIADDAFSTRWCCSRYATLTGKLVAGVKEIAQEASASPEAAQVLREYGERLAQFLLPLCTRFAPDAIVLGGNIAKSYLLFSGAMQSVFMQYGVNYPILTSTLLDSAAIVGAASLFSNK